MTCSLLAVLALAGQARADDATGADIGPDGTRGDESTTRWYGWQTLTADALTVTSFVLAGELGPAPLAWLGVGSFLLAPPMIHMAHENWLAAGVSFGVRAGSATLFVAGLAIALSNLDFGGEGSSSDGDDGAAIVLSVLGFAGIVASPIVDAALATEQVEDDGSAWMVLPWVSPRGGGLAMTARL